MAQIYAYLIFDGECQEAMTFYQHSLGSKLNMVKVKDSPMAGQWPASEQEKILHASLEMDGIMLLGSDMTGGEPLVRGNAINLSLVCHTEKELHLFFTNLSVRGKVTRPLHKFFDGTIGALTDQYGINWLLKL